MISVHIDDGTFQLDRGGLRDSKTGRPTATASGRLLCAPRQNLGRVCGLLLLALAALIITGCSRSHAQPDQPAREQGTPEQNTPAARDPQIVAMATATATVTPLPTPTSTSTVTPTASPTVSPTAISPAEGGAERDSDTDIDLTQPLTLSAPITAGFAISTLLQLPLPGNTPLSTTLPLSATAALTPTTTISQTDELSKPVTHDGRLLLVPTPTPVEAEAVLPQPTPDGVSRTARVPILMYHYLSEPPPGSDIYRQDLSVAPDRFAAHLDAIRSAGYTTISLYELLAYLTNGAPLPDQPVIITFDDGYRDNYENALPLLVERDMTASFFVVTDFMDEERPDYLTWEMARAMLAAGMSIESHGRNHVSLAGKNDDYLVWQALGSLETIEFELGVRPRFVSYPAGDYDQRTLDVFASANYWAGLTTQQGATHSSDGDLFQLRRVRVRYSTTPEELLRLLALDW